MRPPAGSRSTAQRGDNVRSTPEAAEKRELSLLIEERYLYEISELASERLNALIEPGQVGFDLSPKQSLMGWPHDSRQDLAQAFFWVQPIEFGRTD